MVLVAPPASPRAMVDHMESNLPWYARLFFDLEPGEALRRLDPVPETAIRTLAEPLLVVHGTADLVVPIEHGRRLFGLAASARKRMCEVPGEDHAMALFAVDAVPRVRRVVSRRHRESVEVSERPRSRALAVAVVAALAPAAAHAGGSVTGIADVRYQIAPGDAAAIDNAFTAGAGVRALPGRRLTACLGADARGGAGGGGALYAAELYPLGVGLRYAGTSTVSLCAGVGVAGGGGDAVPRAWTFPVELRWEGTGAFAVVRPLLVARAVRVAGAEAREDGSPLLSAADEIHLAAGLRVMIPSQPLPGLAAADGVFLGVTYDEAMGDRILGVALGYAFAAGN